MKNALNIALKLEGPSDERGGMLRLDDLLSEIRALQDALESLDRDLHGRSTLYYRVVNLSHRKVSNHRAGTVVIEPVLKQRMKGPRIKNKYGHYPEKIHHKFFQTIRAISDDKAKSLSVSEEVIDAISDLLAGLGRDFSGGEIGNKQSKFRLDSDLQAKVDGLRRPHYKSHGSFSGHLLAMNVAAKKSRFYIYPEIGPKSVACEFPESLFHKAHQLIRKNVRVYGTKCYRERTGFPFKIADVSKIELLDPSQPYPQFTPPPVRVVGKSADEAVRELREESDDL